MHVGLQLAGRLIVCVTATVAALIAAVAAQRVVLPVPSTTVANPSPIMLSPGCAVPAELCRHCPVRAGAISTPSIDALVPATLAEWLCLPSPARAPRFPHDVPAVASTGL